VCVCVCVCVWNLVPHSSARKEADIVRGHSAEDDSSA